VPEREVGYVKCSGVQLGGETTAEQFTIEDPPPRPRAAVFLGARYALLALVAYVILRFSVLNLPALLGGIFVAVAAVILEIIFELLYARN
jgi:hypothetical protein